MPIRLNSLLCLESYTFWALNVHTTPSKYISTVKHVKLLGNCISICPKIASHCKDFSFTAFANIQAMKFQIQKANCLLYEPYDQFESQTVLMSFFHLIFALSLSLSLFCFLYLASFSCWCFVLKHLGTKFRLYRNFTNKEQSFVSFLVDEQFWHLWNEISTSLAIL